MKKILIIEDEQDVLDLLEMILGGEGYSTTATADPSEAVVLAKRESPDLILCDIAMPETDGYAVLEALQADPATAGFPTMFLTGRQQFTERVKAFRSGVVDYMTKPFTRETLLGKIRQLFEKLPARA